MSRAIKDVSPLHESNRILDKTVRDTIRETGCLQKTIAIDAGMDSVNHMTALRKNKTASLQMAAGLKRALPNLPLPEYVGAILSEAHPSVDAQEAPIKFCDFFAQLPRLENDLMSILMEVRDELSGFAFPDTLSLDAKMGIKALIVAEVQRETRAVHDLD